MPVLLPSLGAAAFNPAQARNLGRVVLTAFLAQPTRLERVAFV